MSPTESRNRKKTNMAARRPFWKWRCWKSIGSYPYTWVLCRWSLKLIFKAKVNLESGNQIIQYGRQAAILNVMSLKINRLLPMATIKMHMKFEIEIPKQTWLLLRKPCRLQTDGRLRENTNALWWEISRFFGLLRIIEESGVYQLGVPQGQGDSSAPSTTDPLICGFCLVTTPNTRSKTVEQSIVTWMFAREFITNRHPVAPQLTNKPCTNGRLRENTNALWWEISTDGRTDGRTDGQGESSIPPSNFVGRGYNNSNITLVSQCLKSDSSTVCSTAYSVWQQRKHKSITSL